jgi:hypothetical protein
MMVAVAKQAMEALKSGQRFLIDLDPAFCGWMDTAFREILQKEISQLP